MADAEYDSTAQRGGAEPQQDVLLINEKHPQHRSLREAFTNEDAPVTYFVVNGSNDDDSPTTPSRVEIEIVNPKSPEMFWYSVTIVSHNKYTGTAMNMGVMDTGLQLPSLVYYWKPLFQGEYQVIVHELPNFLSGHDKTIPIADPFPITIENKPYVKSWSLVAERMKTMPPCQSVRRPGLFTTWEGEWIGPGLFTPEGTLRTGWYFLPGIEMDCKIEMYTDVELSVVPEMKSIYVIGTSRERGVFLSLVDMLLDLPEKKYLGNSVIAKCWGRAYIVKNNLKVMYQDWRSSYFEPENSEPNVLCHNDTVVREGGSLLFNNGLKVFEEIFQDPTSWPSVILMSSGGNIGFRGDYDLQKFISSLPPAWEGTLFLTDGTFSAMHSGRGSIYDYAEYRRKLRSLTSNMFDRRVQWLDGLGISRDMRMYSEDGPDHVSRSQHFHSQCNEPFTVGLEYREKRMRVCSNITEVVAQLLINFALGPKDRFVEKVERLGIKPAGEAKMMYCHACPADLLPFHITPYPDMTCDTGVLVERIRTEVSNGGSQTCPAECLELEITKYIPTQSGYANERLCPMDIFFHAATRATKSSHIDFMYNPFYFWSMIFMFAILLKFHCQRIKRRLSDNRRHWELYHKKGVINGLE